MITFWIFVVILVLFIVALAVLLVLALVQAIRYIVQWGRDKILKSRPQ